MIYVFSVSCLMLLMLWSHFFIYWLFLFTVFSSRCNIYISRLCYDVRVRLSVCDWSALVHYSKFRFQILIQLYHSLWSQGGVISTTPSRAMLATARPFCSFTVVLLCNCLFAESVVSLCLSFRLNCRPVHSIWAVMLRAKIIRTVLCRVVYDSCAQ